MRRVGRGSRMVRVTAATALALSSAGADRLVRPDPVAAIDCNLVLNPFAGNDPAPGDPAYVTNEDTDAILPAPGILANDSCYGSSSTMTVVSSYGGTFTLGSDGSVHYSPVQDGYGAAQVTYHFTSQYGTSNDAHADFTVVSVNDPPNINASGCAAPITLDEDSGLFVWPCLVIADGGAIYEYGQALVGHATGQPASAFSSGPTFDGLRFGDSWRFQLTFMTAPNVNGETTRVNIWITDDGGTANGGQNESAHLGFPVTINPVDDPPVASDDAYTTPIGTILSVGAQTGVLANDIDVDGTTLAVDPWTQPKHGQLALLSIGAFTYTPEPSFSGVDTFTYEVISDSKTDIGTVTITVLAAGVTPAPTASSGPSTPAASTAPASSSPSGSSAAPGSSGSPEPSGGLASPATPSSGPGQSGDLTSGGPGGIPIPPGSPDGAGSPDAGALVVLVLAAVLVAALGLRLYRDRRRGPSA